MTVRTSSLDPSAQNLAGVLSDTTDKSMERLLIEPDNHGDMGTVSQRDEAVNLEQDSVRK